MGRPRVDLSALRTRRFPRLPRATLTAIELLDNQSRLSLTRREMLGIAGTAAATLPLKFGAPEGRLQFVPGHKCVAFRLDGRERWAVDARRFTGTPVLRVEQSAKQIRIALANARYPGTGLPADFDCKLERTSAGWRMNLRMALGGFNSEAPFERWLRGDAPVRSAVQLDNRIEGFGDSSRLAIVGRAQAEFLPNWTLRLAGKGIARLTGFGGQTVSDSLVIALLNPGAPSIASKPQERRTLLAMNRGGRSWPFQPRLGLRNGSKIKISDTAFDRIRIETGEDAGTIRRALVAESQTEKAGIVFVPDGNFSGSDGKPFRLPLRNLRYAIVADSAGRQAALVANYARESAWVHADGCSFEIGDSADAPAFEAVSTNGQAPRIRCTPALKQIAAPLPGVIVQTRPVEGGTQLAFLGAQDSRRIIIRRPQTIEQPVQKPTQKKQIRIPNIRLGTIRVVQKGKKAKKGKKKALQQIQIPRRPGPSFTFDLIRPDDLLAITFDFYNMTLSAGEETPSVVRVQPNQPAFLVVRFGPQHIAEEVFLEGNTPQPLPKQDEPPVQSRLAGASRLAFIVPDNVAGISYTLTSLLDWAQFEQSVTPLATPPKPVTFARPTHTGSAKAVKEPQVQVIQSSPQYYQEVQPSFISTAPVVNSGKKKKKKKRQSTVQMQAGLAQMRQGQIIQLAQIKEPEAFQTSIEAPYRIMLSPNYYAGWAHSAKPVVHGSQTELWHTRLGVRSHLGKVDERNEFYRTVRAVWATDFYQGCLANLNDIKDSTPFTPSAISTQDRYQIVRLSSDTTIRTVSNNRYIEYSPQPIKVNHLMLSTLGAWMDTNGVWDPPMHVHDSTCPAGQTFSFDLENWRHIAAVGRDQYVRIVQRGYLFPFGHRAVHIKITERKFNRTPSGKMAAYLRKQQFVVVREHEKTYPAGGQQHAQGPGIPFQSVRIHTLSTPALQPVTPIPGNSQSFWVQVDNQDFQFKMTGVDWEGKTSEFAAPLIFVPRDPATKPGHVPEVFKAYHDEKDSSRCIRPFFGQKVAYAKNKLPGDTSFETDSMTFSAEPPEQGATVPMLQPYFYPAMSRSAVRITTVEQLTGRSAATDIEYYKPYLDHGIEASVNQGQVFASLVDKVPLLFGGSGGSSDKVGGLLTPSMEINGLSRLLGPVAGTLDTIAGGTFDPAQFFKSALDAKLLGDISLADVISSFPNISSDIKKVPKFVTSHLPHAIETRFTWQPKVKDVSEPPDPNKPKAPPNPAYFKFTDDPSKVLTVTATLTKTLDGKPPTYDVKAVMKSFELHLVPSVVEVLIITFNELSFHSVNGQKPDVNADIDKIVFTGPLSFVNELKNLIPPGGGLNDPPSLDVTPHGIEAGYSLGLPPASIGVFNLSNVSLAAQLNIYFTGDPITFEFDFCQEHHPFLLTVSLFGGGGYFGITLTPHGIQRMAAELEFGGSFALNLGVASGGVYLMAGLNYTHTNGNTELTGYLRCGGALEVLAIITVSVEFKMGLKYVSEGNKVWGRATLTVEVKVLFFSKSVDLTVERQFAGSTQDSALFGTGAPYPLGPTGVHFEDEMTAVDWQLYCEAFA